MDKEYSFTCRQKSVKYVLIVTHISIPSSFLFISSLFIDVYDFPSIYFRHNNFVPLTSDNNHNLSSYNRIKRLVHTHTRFPIKILNIANYYDKCSMNILLIKSLI